jgi:hypothetical protein
MCDVLGFRELIRHTPMEEIAQRYDSLLRATEQAAQDHGFDIERIAGDSFRFTSAPVDRVVFSDSILMWSRTVNPHEAVKDEDGRLSAAAAGAGLIWAVRDMIQDSITRAMPLRVGIAFGACVIDPDRSIYLGPAIVDAYDAEQAQEWVGGACHPSCLSAPGFEGLTSPGPIAQYPVPTKGEFALEWAIDWPETASHEVGVKLREAAGHLVDERHRRKWKNALEFLDARRARFVSAAGSMGLPGPLIS